MLSNLQALGDFKENVKHSVHTKPSLSHSRKALRSCSINVFDDASNAYKIKNTTSKSYTNKCNASNVDKENSKQKIKKIEETKTVSHQDDWSDIEEFHIYVDPDDNYEDILPKCERIQKADIDSLFMSFTFTRYNELAVDDFSTPPRDLKNVDFPDLPSSSPPIPTFKASLFDDTPLDIIPLPADLFIGGQH